jgi:RNA polymerase sigma-70 factor (sigma-E family)
MTVAGRPPGRGPGWDADEAVAQLFAEHYRRLVRLSVLLVRDPETAEEVVQDSFVAVHGKWGSLEDPDKGLAYLRQTVVNRSRSVLRHRGVQLRVAPVLEADHRRSVDDGTATGVRRRVVLDALQKLPTRQREVIALRYYLDLDEATIAEVLGISRGAVKSHAFRAAAALRTLLEDSHD